MLPVLLYVQPFDNKMIFFNITDESNKHGISHCFYLQHPHFICLVMKIYCAVFFHFRYLHRLNAAYSDRHNIKRPCIDRRQFIEMKIAITTSVCTFLLMAGSLPSVHKLFLSLSYLLSLILH